MSNLQNILVSAKRGLALGQAIPQSRWPAIAAQCGRDEVAEMHIRINMLRAELQTIEALDGDAQDDTHTAIHFFLQLAALCSQ